MKEGREREHAAARDFRRRFRKPPPTTPTTLSSTTYRWASHVRMRTKPPTTAVRDQSRPGGTWWIWKRSLARSNGHGPAARFGQLVAGHFLDFREIKCQCCNLC